MKEMNWMFEYKGFLMKMVSNPEVFSPQGIDKGTLAMLSFVNFNKFHRVLDLGCGSGIVGIFASKFGKMLLWWINPVRQLNVQ